MIHRWIFRSYSSYHSISPKTSLKILFDSEVAKMFNDSYAIPYDEVNNSEFEEAILVFDPNNMHSHANIQAKRAGIESFFLTKYRKLNW